MPTTVDQFANEMALEAGEDYSDAQVSTLFRAWTTEAFINTAASSRFLWTNKTYTLVTTDGVAEYTLDAEVAEIKAIRIPATDTLVGYNTEESLTRLNINFEEAGVPAYWFFSGIDSTSTAFKVQFVPVPDGVYTLELRALVRPAELGTSTVIPLPIEFVETMRHYVRAQYQYNDDRLQLAASSMQMYQNMLLTYVSRYTAPRRQPSTLRILRLAGQNQAPAASTS